MTSHVPGSCYDEQNDNSGNVAESGNDTDDEVFEDIANGGAHGQHDTDVDIGSLDDEALFGILKKIVCVSVRKLISATSEPPDSSKRASYGAAGCGNPKSVRVRGPPTKTITQLNVSYFSKVLDALKKEKREIIQSYGFGSLLLFDKCCIPLPFARWVVDHIQVSSSAIVVNNRSIPLSPQTVHDVLGIPIGGHTIRKGDAENGKGAFLNGMNLTTLPSAKFFGDNLSKDNISDDDLVRSFLIVALVTFLCPNSNVHPSTEYLQPLVDVKKAKEWDWSEFVHYWLLKQIKMYNDQMKRLDHASITMGGCLYIVCVVYLDFLNFGNQHLPRTLPRIVVWKGNMIKDKSKLDSVQGYSYGRHTILPLKSTCYHRRSGTQTPSPTCIIDGANFKKLLTESVDGTMSNEILDDVTALYMRHAAASNDSVAENAKTIILDVVGYFFQRAQLDRNSLENSNHQMDGAENNSGHDGNSKDENVNSSCRDVNIDVNRDNVVLVDHEVRANSSQVVKTDPPGGEAVELKICAARGDALTNTGENDCADTNLAQAACPHADDIRLQDAQQQYGANSGDTVVIPSAADDCSSVPESVAETEKVPSSQNDTSDQYDCSQGVYKLRRRLSISSASGNNENVVCNIAGRTRSRRASLSPDILATVSNQVDFVDNPEAILRKKRVRRFASCSQDQADPTFGSHSDDANEASAIGDLHTTNSSQPHAPIANRVINNMNNEAQDRCADETIQGQPPHVPNDDEFLQMGQQQLPDILQHEGNKNGTPLGLAHASIGVTQGCSSQTITPKRQKTQHSSMNCEAQDRCADETTQGHPLHVPNEDELTKMGQQQLPDALSHEKSASFDHMLGSRMPNDRITPIDQPSVNKNGTPLGSTHPSIGVIVRGNTMNPSVPVSLNPSRWDDSAPSFRLIEEFDDYGNYIDDPRKRRQVGLPCDGKTIYDDPTCLESINVAHSTSVDKAHYPTYTQPFNPNSTQRPREPCSSYTIGNLSGDERNQQNSPVYDTTPDLHPHNSSKAATSPVPLAAVDSHGRLIVLSSQESPDVCVTGHKAIVASPEVQITREKSFTTACNTMLYEVNQRYNNESDMSCFQKCQRIGFNLGSSSAGKRSRRPRRIAQPNSYFRNFQVNVCNAKFTTSVQGKLAYDCLMFYSSIPDYSSKELINYDNVRVTFGELGRSLSRSNKKSVHIHVINAFCRKLFRDKHPKYSHKHYFFSPVGDYLMNHEGKQSYMFEKCGKCFRLANGSFNFVESDYLFFPIFHEDHWFLFIVALQDGYFVFLDSFFDEDDMYQKEARSLVIPNFLRAWDQFIGIDWNFDEFVIHHAPVPKQKTKQDTKQDLKFFSKYDDGIFVMKYMEIWDPCVNMMVQFSSSNINDIRIQYVGSMVFSQHNSCHHGKATINNHKAMVELKERADTSEGAHLLFSVLIFCSSDPANKEKNGFYQVLLSYNWSSLDSSRHRKLHQ